MLMRKTIVKDIFKKAVCSYRSVLIMVSVFESYVFIKVFVSERYENQCANILSIQL